MKKNVTFLLSLLFFTQLLYAQKVKKNMYQLKLVKCKLVAIEHKRDTSLLIIKETPVSFTVQAEKNNYVLPLTLDGYKVMCFEFINNQKLAVTGMVIRLTGKGCIYEYELDRVNLDQWTITVSLNFQNNKGSSEINTSVKILLIGEKIPYTHPLFRRLVELYNESHLQKLKPAASKEYKSVTYNLLNLSRFFDYFREV